jgi:GTP:adenosylcobinamide-phosphate guanylyltransferase
MITVITAGGRIHGEFAREAGTTVKALAKVRGVSMLERAIAAARGAGTKSVAVVGGAEVRDACASSVDRVIAESDDGGQNVLRALDAAGSDDLLYLTSDLPYINERALRAFVDAVPSDTLAMAISSMETFTQRFPGAPRFGINLGGQSIVNGGAFVVPAGRAPRVAELAAAFFAARKSSWAMAMLLGPNLLWRYATSRLTVPTLEAHATERLRFPARAIRGCSPELCYDADSVAEYRYALKQP